MTTQLINNIRGQRLWFAQNSLPLWLKWQLNWDVSASKGVVICSKFITFVVEKTTLNNYFANAWVLWFAQNSLPLWLKWQPHSQKHQVLFGCDLLKIHYLCGWNDNQKREQQTQNPVVICSKFITFVVEMTTFWEWKHTCQQLWFAQNSLPLWLKWQRLWTSAVPPACCDLLKIHYLCGWNDNEGVHHYRWM